MSTNTVTKEKINLDIDLGKTYSLVMHNDDTTPFDFVIYVLVEVVFKTPTEAIQIAMYIHENGKKKVLQGQKEQLEQKRDKCIAFATEMGFSDFKVTVEEDDK